MQAHRYTVDSMRNNDRLLQIVENTLSNFDELTASAAARRALRIASLAKDKPAEIWLRREGQNMGQQFNPDVQATALARTATTELSYLPERQAFVILISDFRSYYERRRIGDSTIIPNPLEEIESHIELTESEAGRIVGSVPGNMAYAKVIEARVRVNEERAVLSRTKDAIFDYLLSVEKRLVFEATAEDIFARARQRVDANLSLVSREALDQFTSAQERLIAGDPEALSHALLSCRRILKSVADAVYPARNEPVVGADGKERSLTDDRYINRLLQFTAERMGKHGTGGILQASLSELGSRLSATDGLANKGVHSSVTTAEVEACIIQTYLIIGEIISVP